MYVNLSHHYRLTNACKKLSFKPLCWTFGASSIPFSSYVSSVTSDLQYGHASSLEDIDLPQLKQ